MEPVPGLEPGCERYECPLVPDTNRRWFPVKESNLVVQVQSLNDLRGRTGKESGWERRESNPLGLGKNQLCGRYITPPREWLRRDSNPLRTG
jgi:hypothetical protein